MVERTPTVSRSMPLPLSPPGPFRGLMLAIRLCRDQRIGIPPALEGVALSPAERRELANLAVRSSGIGTGMARLRNVYAPPSALAATLAVCTWLTGGLGVIPLLLSAMVLLLIAGMAFLAVRARRWTQAPYQDWDYRLRGVLDKIASDGPVSMPDELKTIRAELHGRHWLDSAVYERLGPGIM